LKNFQADVFFCVRWRSRTAFYRKAAKAQRKREGILILSVVCLDLGVMKNKKERLLLLIFTEVVGDDVFGEVDPLKSVIHF
jgi:hypothetical protein